VSVSGELDTDGLALMSAELHMPHDDDHNHNHGDRHHHGDGGVAGGGGVAEEGGCALDDVQLRLPLRAVEVPLLNGFDTNGGRRPREVHWRWDAEKPDPDHAQRGLNCRVWLGSAAAGLQLNLQGTEQVISLSPSYHPRAAAQPAGHRAGGACVT
jgi:hypothetical protein